MIGWLIHSSILPTQQTGAVQDKVRAQENEQYREKNVIE